MLYHAVDILKEPYVPELIYLVVSDGLPLKLGLDLFQVIGAGSYGSYAASREGDL